jgi:hypothetical protein
MMKESRRDKRPLKTFATLTCIAAGLLQAGTTSIAAQAGSRTAILDNARTASPRVHLEIIDLVAPTVIELRRQFAVTFTAADVDGVGTVRVQFGDEVQWLSGQGLKVFNGVAPFETTGLGVFQVSATVYGIGGRTSGPTWVQDVTVIATDPNFDYTLAPVKDVTPGYTDQTGGTTPVQNPFVGIDKTPWWKQYQSKFAKPRFDWVNSCGGFASTITPNGEVLHCWLAFHPEVRKHLIWEYIDYGPLDPLGTLTGQAAPAVWEDWSDFDRALLDAAFYHAYLYLDSGATAFGGPVLPDAPDNQILLADDESDVTFFSEFDAKRMYMATVAHSLALEIGGFVPWSITTYNDDDLDVLFNAHYQVKVEYDTWTINGVDRSYLGYRPGQINVSEAPPVTTFNWLVANNIIGPNHLLTVGRLLEWGRAHQIHEGLSSASPLWAYRANLALLQQAIWQYRGMSPAVRVMNLTTFVDPFTGHTYGPGPTGWTQNGCQGEGEFLQVVLRAANIPVVQMDIIPGGGHSTALFRTLGMMMGHGDDVYDVRLAAATPMAPGEAILISIATFNAWFQSPGLPTYFNLYRALYEVELKYLSNRLLEKYCSDQATGQTHASGDVYAEFLGYDGITHFYTVQELEAVNLWDNLKVKAGKLGYCKP